MEQETVVQASGAQAPTTDTGFHDFWQHFRPFGSKLDEFFLRRWFVFVVVYCLLLLILDLSLDFHQGIGLGTILGLIYSKTHFYHHLPSYTANDLTNWILLSQGVALVLMAVTFNYWLGSIPRTFQRLFDKGRICCINKDHELPDEYHQFLQRYESTLQSKRRFLLAGFFMILVLVLILLLVLPGKPSLSSARDLFSSSVSIIRWPIFLIIIYGLFIGYCAAIGVWITGVTGWYLRKLTKEFNLVLQPRHPDKCGGLRFLGSFCLNVAVPVLIATIFLGVYGIGLALFLKQMDPFILAATIFLFLIALPLAAIAFIVPLWDIHVKMKQIREDNADKFAVYISSLENNVRSSVESGNWAEAYKVKAELDLVQVLLTDNFGTLTWPFNTRKLLIFATPQFLLLTSLFLTLLRMFR